MAKFRKKPVVIDAVQFKGEKSLDEIALLFDGKRTLGYNKDTERLYIDTLEGVMEARRNDWIIKGIKGECYPCKPDIFEATYEEVV